jgi:hypothetical protein
MATVSVTYTFPNDAGGAAEVAEWSETSDPDGTHTGPFHETGDGNPIACQRIRCGNTGGSSSRGLYLNEQSLEDFGVPAGATVTQIKNINADYNFEVNDFTWAWLTIEFRIDGGLTIGEISSGLQFSVPGWTAMTPDDSSFVSEDSTALLGITLNLLATTADDSAAYVNHLIDNLTFDIEYTGGAAPEAVDLSGSTSQAAQDSDGDITVDALFLNGSTSQPVQISAGDLSVISLIDFSGFWGKRTETADIKWCIVC